MSDKKGSASKIKMASVDDLFAIDGAEDSGTERVTHVEISKLQPFKNHPFRVLDDDKMQETVESVQRYGVLNPILVRPVKPQIYEIVAGHRRKRACEILGIEKVPCIIRELSEEEATIIMVDSNIQREELLFSEKAFAYRMKLEAIKKQGKRNDLTCGQIGHRNIGKKSVGIIGEEMGESQKQVQRYIRLTYLVKELLDCVDNRKIPFNAGVEISYLEPGEQELLVKAMEEKLVYPNLAQAVKIKQMSREGKLDAAVIEVILGEARVAGASVKLQRKKLDHFFPKDYSSEQIEEVIFDLLQKWSFERDKKYAGV